MNDMNGILNEEVKKNIAAVLSTEYYAESRNLMNFRRSDAR